MSKRKTAAGKVAFDPATASPAARRKHFLAVLKDTANVTKSAQAAGIKRQTVYRQRARSESFRAAWDETMNQALDELEAVLLERAVHGVEKPVFYGGKACGSVRQYSDALAIFMLKARRPEVYGRAQADSGELDGEADPAGARQDIHDRLNRMVERLKDEGAGRESGKMPRDDGQP